MKKIFLLLVFQTLLQFCKAQITFVDTINHTYLRHYHFKYAGDKIVDQDNVNNVMTLYNLDCSIWKTITIPPPTIPYTSYQELYLSETLFDTDSSDFEFIQTILGLEFPIAAYHTLVYDESGSLLFSKDSVAPGSITNAEGTFLSIYNTDSGTYMQLYAYPASGNLNKTYIYKLPGKLDEQCCCQSNLLATGESEFNKQSDDFSLNSFPNPSKNSTKVFYTLPSGITHGALIFYDLNGNEVKRFQVSNQFQFILVSTGNLPAGTYIYHLETSEGISEGKQQVVIR